MLPLQIWKAKRGEPISEGETDEKEGEKEEEKDEEKKAGDEEERSFLGDAIEFRVDTGETEREQKLLEIHHVHSPYVNLFQVLDSVSLLSSKNWNEEKAKATVYNVPEEMNRKRFREYSEYETAYQNIQFLLI